ncbi:MAG: cold shock domain-containing protein, partial [Marinobacter adhaerens]
YGFIIEDGCSDDLFAHFSSVQMDGYKTLKAGQAVTFDKKPSDKGIHAVNIVPDELPASKAQTDASSDSAGQSSQQESGRDGYPPRAVNA